MRCCLEAAPDVFILRKVKKKGARRATVSIDVRDEWITEIQHLRELASLSKPVIMPTTEIPAAWTGWRNGGFWTERSHWLPALCELTTKKPSKR